MWSEGARIAHRYRVERMLGALVCGVMTGTAGAALITTARASDTQPPTLVSVRL